MDAFTESIVGDAALPGSKLWATRFCMAQTLRPVNPLPNESIRIIAMGSSEGH